MPGWRWIGLAGAAAVAVVAAACTARADGNPKDGETGAGAGRNEGGASPGGGQESGEVRTAGGLVVRLVLGADTVTAGAPVELTLEIRNEADAEAVVDFPNGQRFDFEILRDGTSVWRWAKDMFFPQVLGRERIPPGDTLRWNQRYEDGLEPGAYTARAVLTANDPVTVQRAFAVVP